MAIPIYVAIADYTKSCARGKKNIAVLTPTDHFQNAADTAVLRCPGCKVPDNFTVVKESYVDGRGFDVLAVRCNKCRAFIQVCGPVEWKKQVIKVSRHE